jgi:hypothetical protein
MHLAERSDEFVAFSTRIDYACRKDSRSVQLVLPLTGIGYTRLPRFSRGSERSTNDRHRAGRRTELWPWPTQVPQFGDSGIFAAELLRWLNQKLERLAL